MSLTYLVMYTMSRISYNMLATLSNCTLAFSMATNLLTTLLIAYKLRLVNYLSPNINDNCLFLAGSTEKPGAILV